MKGGKEKNVKYEEKPSQGLAARSSKLAAHSSFPLSKEDDP